MKKKEGKFTKKNIHKNIKNVLKLRVEGNLRKNSKKIQ